MPEPTTSRTQPGPSAAYSREILTPAAGREILAPAASREILVAELLACTLAGRPLPDWARPHPAPAPRFATAAAGIEWILTGTLRVTRDV